MRGKGFDAGMKLSDARKAFVLKQAEDGVPVAQVGRKADISQATFFNCEKKPGGMLCEFKAA